MNPQFSIAFPESTVYHSGGLPVLDGRGDERDERDAAHVDDCC